MKYYSQETLDYLTEQCKKLYRSEDREKFNGFSFTAEGKIRNLIYDSIGLKLSYEVLDKLNLKSLLGKKYTDKLFQIFVKRNDYDIFSFLFDKESDEATLLSIKGVKKEIDRILNREKFISECIYQSFYFDMKIKEMFYAGNIFSNHKEKMDVSEGLDLIEEMLNTGEELFPTLREKIEEIIGKDNCIYDFYEFGQKEFSLYWNIHKSVYDTRPRKPTTLVVG